MFMVHIPRVYDPSFRVYLVLKVKGGLDFESQAVLGYHN